MKVLVTGGKGFIGAHTVDALHAAGHEAVVFDAANHQDVRSLRSIEKATEGMDAVIHLAGILGTGELFGMPQLAVDVNVNGALNVLQACAENDLRYVGICMPSVWANVYQATKRCAADMATAWHENFGVPVSHVRAYNAYGIGQKVVGVQKIIPTFSTKAWRGEPIPIWGDGSQVVDLVWVGDVAKMLVDALRFGDDQVFDAGTGSTFTVRGVAEMILEHTGSDSKIEMQPMRLGEKKAYPFAHGEGWGRLNWQPVFRHREFAKTVDWYKEERP